MSMIKLKSSSGKKTVFECETRGETFKKMQTFFRDRKFCDVVLVAGNDSTQVSAHRIVLSAASEYFLELLEKSPTAEVILEGVDGEILQVLVNFIYTATLDIRGDTVDNIMITASRLKLDAVVTECTDFLGRKLSKVNCLPVAMFSQMQNYPDLCEKSFMYACQNFTELIQEEPFLQLDVDQLCKLLSRNDLCVKSEEDVFQAIVSWIRYDNENRQKFTHKLLSVLRFPLLEPEFIIDNVEEACKGLDCESIILKAMKWHMSSSSRTNFPKELSAPRNQKREIILIKGGTEVENSVVAEIFDPLEGGWTCQEWPPKPQPGWYTNGIFSNDKVYLAGTKVQQTREIGCLDCFDITTKQWSELPSMTAQRFSFGMVELNGMLYAIGGNDGAENLRTVEKWDPNSPILWQEVASMHAARSHPGVAVLDGLLYAIGSNNDFEVNTFEFYDPETNTWAELAPPVQARTSVGLTAVNGYLYAVGGRTQGGICTIVERYDPNTDSWLEISPSGKYNQYQQSGASLDRLIVLVEVNKGRVIHVLEEYNPETEQWRTLNPLQRHYGTVILIAK